ncbi:helix-turn-helix domain-containing protein [Variovorax sp. dw_954]|uniref:helix-turn-helix domain-containing protein n=1 Tax=Variovorax sp. dw_954 TaxID=2720078 RepID=UPI001BD2394C|nr:helix-turn-helix domain-containing protein [Variovorax sp. dw_954]
MHSNPPALPPERAAQIAQARREVIESAAPDSPRVAPWISRSWLRCLSAGHRPQQRVSFDAVSAQHARRMSERNRGLVAAARPVLDRLARAIADTGYFAILTDARGVVIDARGLPPNAERAATNIARVGVDLSERAVGTSAIGAALSELQPVWLHRGEHFFDDTSVFSCAGAPLFGHDGRCVGMLDLSAVNAVERPELRQLAALSARSIENALVLREPHDLLVRLNWPGWGGHAESEGLLCLDSDGHVTASNAAAREMVNQSAMTAASSSPLHASDLFALPWTVLWDAARRADATPIEVPLWSGLRLQALPLAGRGSDDAMTAAGAPAPRPRLRDVEAALIRKAVAEARGNVAEAARVLGISRATVYRKLGHRGR